MIVRLRRRWEDAEVTEVNIVPVIDLCLVLLVILMVLSPLLDSSSADVLLPRASTREEKESHVLVTIAQDGQTRISGDTVPRGELRTYMEKILQVQGADRLVVLDADRRLPFRELADVMKLVKEAGAENLSFGSEPYESGGDR